MSLNSSIISIPSYSTIQSIATNVDRINALYCPFRPRNINPESYDEKLKFWTKTIEDFTCTDKRSSFTIRDLQTATSINGKKPACLQEVLHHLIRNGHIMAYENFLNSIHNNSSWFWWSMTPVKWAFNKMWSSPNIDISLDMKFVFKPAVKNMVELIKNNSEMSRILISKEDWIEELKIKVGIREDIDLICDYMKTTGEIVCDKVGNVEVVKMKSGSRRESIKEVEKSQFDIRKSQEKFESDLQKLYQQQSLAELNARSALKEGKRATAKHHLRTKKILEKRADKLNDILDNLSALSFQIDDSQSDAIVLQAYQRSKDAMNKILKENNISGDMVTNVLLDLQEAIEDQTEISESISKPIVEDADTEELEAELENLMSSKDDLTQSDLDALKQLEELSMKDLDNFEKDKEKTGTPKDFNDQESPSCPA